MENLRSRCRLANQHIGVRRELQVTFDTGRRVFRALTFIAVRKQHGQTALAAPLRFAGADELIDYDLSAVGKVTELGFPNRQALRRRAGVTVFECKNRLLRQNGVNYRELGLMFSEMLQRNPDASGHGFGHAKPHDDD